MLFFEIRCCSRKNKKIDTKNAQSASGVVGVYTGDDIAADKSEAQSADGLFRVEMVLLLKNLHIRY